MNLNNESKISSSDLTTKENASKVRSILSTAIAPTFATEINYDNIAHIINKHSKKQINYSTNYQYNFNRRMISMSKKRKKRNYMINEYGPKKNNYNFKQINVFNALNVES